MRRFVEGLDRGQNTLFPECLEDWIGEDNPVRVIESCRRVDLGASAGCVRPGVSVEGDAESRADLLSIIATLLKLQQGFHGLQPMPPVSGSGAPSSSVVDLGVAGTMGLLTQASVAIDGSKFKAVNNRDKNFTRAKMDRRMAQIEESVARYLQQLDTADRQEPSEALKTKTSRLKEKIAVLKEQMQRLEIAQGANACGTGPADIADRSRCPLDGDQRSRLWRRRLQRPGRRRHEHHLIVTHK